jgi:primosomal replication protein N
MRNVLEVIHFRLYSDKDIDIQLIGLIKNKILKRMTPLGVKILIEILEGEAHGEET